MSKEEMFPPKTVKQKKEHVCYICDVLMPVGETVHSHAGKVNGKFVSYYSHVDPLTCDGNLAKKGHA